jgi:DNA end-binding protein Ku
VRREFVDSETGKPVEPGEQVKGYETEEGDYVVLEPEDVAAAVPDSGHMLDVEAFLPCEGIDDLYFDRPYYLAPSEKSADEAFVLIREGLKAKKVAALAHSVLFRRMRTVLVRAQGKGLVATLLNFDYEVRSAEKAFEAVPKLKITGEMLELAGHIIEMKRGRFAPQDFTDRYEEALKALVEAKLAGKAIRPRKERKSGKVVDLMQALRDSAALSGRSKAQRRKAG